MIDGRLTADMEWKRNLPSKGCQRSMAMFEAVVTAPNVRVLDGMVCLFLRQIDIEHYNEAVSGDKVSTYMSLAL